MNNAPLPLRQLPVELFVAHLWAELDYLDYRLVRHRTTGRDWCFPRDDGGSLSGFIRSGPGGVAFNCAVWGPLCAGRLVAKLCSFSMRLESVCSGAVAVPASGAAVDGPVRIHATACRGRGPCAHPVLRHDLSGIDPERDRGCGARSGPHRRGRGMARLSFAATARDARRIELILNHRARLVALASARNGHVPRLARWDRFLGFSASVYSSL